MVNGAVFKVSTRCHTETAAVAQLRRFEGNPSAYRPEGGVGPRLVLDDALIDGFLRHSRDVKRNSAKWVGDQRRALEWWSTKLAAWDLRRLSLATDLVPALDGAVGDRQKREVMGAVLMASDGPAQSHEGRGRDA
jgi:hypothetical protein